MREVQLMRNGNFENVHMRQARRARVLGRFPVMTQIGQPERMLPAVQVEPREELTDEDEKKTKVEELQTL
jgi:hypothetical protein